VEKGITCEHQCLEAVDKRLTHIHFSWRCKMMIFVIVQGYWGQITQRLSYDYPIGKYKKEMIGVSTRVSTDVQKKGSVSNQGSTEGREQCRNHRRGFFWGI
jgi:hypothetical protein